MLSRSGPLLSEFRSEGSDEFKPVDEIRRLRQDLAERINTLLQESAKAKAEVVSLRAAKTSLHQAEESLQSRRNLTNQPTGESFPSPVRIKSEAKETRNVAPSERIQSEKVQAVEAREEKIAVSVERLQKQLDEANELLCRFNATQTMVPPLIIPTATQSVAASAIEMETIVELRAIPTEHFVDGSKVTAQMTDEQQAEIQLSEKFPVTELFADKASDEEDDIPHWIPLFSRLNIGLIILGFLATLFGIFFYVWGNFNETQIGTHVAFLGLSLVVIGIAGRLSQEFVNRFDEGPRGKLTIVS